MASENRDSTSGAVGSELSLFEQVLLYSGVLLGVLASLGLVLWALAQLGQLVAVGLALAPVPVLLLVGRVVRERALADWRAAADKPLVVRVVRAVCIGFAWPLWIKHV